MTHLSINLPRLFAAMAVFVVMVAGAAYVSIDATDPAVQQQQTDLYRLDFFAVPLAQNASATQLLTGDGLVRVDVLARSEERAPLRMRIREAGGELLREETVEVGAGSAPDWAVFTFPAIEGSRELRVTFDAPEVRAAPDVYGSTCDCLDDGELIFDKGDGDAAPTLKDLHLATYTVVGRGARYDLVADRVAAYAPAWLSVPVVVGFGAFGLLAVAFMLGMTAVAASRGLRTRWFAMLVVLAASLPVLLVWIGTPG